MKINIVTLSSCTFEPEQNQPLRGRPHWQTYGSGQYGLPSPVFFKSSLQDIRAGFRPMRVLALIVRKIAKLLASNWLLGFYKR